jgi:hypothetical protein
MVFRHARAHPLKHQATPKRELQENDKVVHETQYFAQPFEAPAWRSQWVEKGK